MVLSKCEFHIFHICLLGISQTPACYNCCLINTPVNRYTYKGKSRLQPEKSVGSRNEKYVVVTLINSEWQPLQLWVAGTEVLWRLWVARTCVMWSYLSASGQWLCHGVYSCHPPFMFAYTFLRHKEAHELLSQYTKKYPFKTVQAVFNRPSDSFKTILSSVGWKVNFACLWVVRFPNHYLKSVGEPD